VRTDTDPFYDSLAGEHGVREKGSVIIIHSIHKEQTPKAIPRSRRRGELIIKAPSRDTVRTRECLRIDQEDLRDQSDKSLSSGADP
jgi:hypothetical protein